jgi:hypothetical protein
MSDENALRSSSAEAGSRAAGAASGLGNEPMDAIVYDVQSAVIASQPRPADYSRDYPYGPPQPTSPAGTVPLPDALRWASDSSIWLIQTAENFFTAVQQPPDFAVPKTFGMSAILGIITALALLFAALRRLDAEPVYYFFFSVLAITICLAQMLCGKSPRLASIIAGAIILPLFTILAAFFNLGAAGGVLCLSVVLVPFGAVLGYLTGTCAAGIFLVMDYLEPYLQRHSMSSLIRGDQSCSRT